MCLQSTCPECGYQPAPTSPSSSLMDAPVLLERSKQLDDAIARLVQERTKVLQRVNELCARTRNLPHDILSTIFRFACPSPGDFDSPPLSYTQDVQPHSNQSLPCATNAILLGAVSVFWRQVAWFTPYIWSSLCLEVDLWNVAWCVNTLRQFFLNSGGLLLSLELDFKKWQSIDGMRHVNPKVSGPLRIGAIQDIVRRYAGKLKALGLINPPSEWLQLPSDEFDRLEGFAVSWFNYPSPPLTLKAGLPPRPLPLKIPFRVHKLTLFAPPTTSIGLNWDAITDLCLYQVDYESCVELFLQCPNLLSYKCLEPKEKKGSGPSWGLLEQPAEHDGLEHLVWHFPNIGPAAFSLFMFEHLVLPSIRTLHLKVAGVAEPEECDGLASAFIRCLPSTLKSVTLEFDVFDLHDPLKRFGILRKWLVSCPVSLEYFCVLGASSCPQMLTELCSDICDDGGAISLSADTVEFLSAVDNRCRFHTWTYCLETSEEPGRGGFNPVAIIRMLRETRILGMKEFRLELPTGGPREESQDWERLFQEGLKEIYGILFKIRIGDEYFEV
ncbi:hypothetical protein P691DRAFT_414250 [Macrolepiota fuliginosa MF-IS2]|uniref:F-box domain-containing protein n=1 Tax=Macrolepiota fuliginosa MF-IS2 TaxID=1400762 RepID=A0A9P5X3J8_9AGAR|nr:hypothetical protein P691DRAFT_414250 [Macrolepiota fuliginosa MF-IS2]